MAESAILAVTGSTGRPGATVARRIAARGLRQVLLVRDRSRAPQLPGCEVREADFSDTERPRGSLAGTGTLLRVPAAETPDRVQRHCAFIDAAAAAGVGHVVYTSFLGAAPGSTFTLGRDHWATEEHLRASGLPHTILRDGLYADFLPSMVGEDGVIRGPAGDGRAAFVAQDDIADAAVAVMLDPERHPATSLREVLSRSLS